MNTILTNEAGANISNDQIVLLPGTYFIQAVSSCYQVGNARLRLYSDTDAAALLYGVNARVSGSSGDTLPLFLTGKFTLAVLDPPAYHYLELQIRATASVASVGLGVAQNLGIPEVFTDILIWKLS